MIVEEEAWLEHYGVKGMQWGVRKKAETVTEKIGAAKQKIGDANLRKNTERHEMLTARANKAKVRLEEIKVEKAALPRGSADKRYALNKEASRTKAQLRKDLEKTKDVPDRGLTNTQKKVLIGAGIAAVVLGSAYASQHYDVEGVRASIRRGESALQYGSIFKKNDALANPNLSPNQVLNTVVKGVNPNYNTMGGSMNCRRCSFAYELRRRGLDVVATPSAVGYGQGETGLINALVKGDKNRISRKSLSSGASFDPESLGNLRQRTHAKDKRVYEAETNSVRSLGDLYSTLASKPNGARGEAVFNQGGFAHSLQWEIFNGVPHLFDSQKGQHFEATEEGLSKFTSKWGQNFGVEVTRLDNVDLDLAFLSRWAKNA